MIRLAIVSPNHALRVGLREMLSSQPGIDVIGEFSDIDVLNRKEIEVLVLTSVSSLHLPELSNNSCAILLLTDSQEQVQSLIDSNIRTWGVISTSASSDELLAAVHAVGEGLWVGAPGLVRGLMRSSIGRVDVAGDESVIEQITPREKEVLQLMAEGLANKQIAMRLNISEHTVKFHLSSLYGKLGAASRTEAVKRGLGLGLITL
ncbi:MAG: response regulator transcription factor [Anaerolineales bacterium]